MNSDMIARLPENTTDAGFWFGRSQGRTIAIMTYAASRVRWKTLPAVPDAQGNVTKLHGIRVGPPPKFETLPGSEFELDVDLVLLAMGFTGPVRTGLLDQASLRSLLVLGRSTRGVNDP